VFPGSGAAKSPGTKQSAAQQRLGATRHPQDYAVLQQGDIETRFWALARQHSSAANIFFSLFFSRPALQFEFAPESDLGDAVSGSAISGDALQPVS